MRCPYCQTDISGTAGRCDACGNLVGARRCPACAFANPVAFRFCGQCGASASGIASPVGTEAQNVSAERMSRSAERRQVTVLFSDMVGWTQLARGLDPEDLGAVLRSYQAACTEVVARYRGYTAQYLGDGVLAYFGYPDAHEDDAERAVRAGLSIVEAIPRLNLHRGVRLAVRIGIATGLVLAGDRAAGGNAS